MMPKSDLVEIGSTVDDGRRLKARVRECPRCGGRHGEVHFLSFQYQTPPNVTHWAACPENGDPILMQLLRRDEVNRESQADLEVHG
jgi:hypothetical protein